MRLDGEGKGRSAVDGEQDEGTKESGSRGLGRWLLPCSIDEGTLTSKEADCYFICK